MTGLILIGGMILMAAAYVTLGVLGRRQRPGLSWRRPMGRKAVAAASAVAAVRRAEIAAEARALPAIPSPRPLPAGPRAIGSAPRVVPGEVVKIYPSDDLAK